MSPNENESVRVGQRGHDENIRMRGGWVGGEKGDPETGSKAQ